MTKIPCFHKELTAIQNSKVNCPTMHTDPSRGQTPGHPTQHTHSTRSAWVRCHLGQRKKTEKQKKKIYNSYFAMQGSPMKC